MQGGGEEGGSIRIVPANADYFSSIGFDGSHILQFKTSNQSDGAKSNTTSPRRQHLKVRDNAV